MSYKRDNSVKIDTRVFSAPVYIGRNISNGIVNGINKAGFTNYWPAVMNSPTIQTKSFQGWVSGYGLAVYCGVDSRNSANLVSGSLCLV
jgi:hypothetical protein